MGDDAEAQSAAGPAQQGRARRRGAFGDAEAPEADEAGRRAVRRPELPFPTIATEPREEETVSSLSQREQRVAGDGRARAEGRTRPLRRAVARDQQRVLAIGGAPVHLVPKGRKKGGTGPADARAGVLEYQGAGGGAVGAPGLKAVDAVVREKVEDAIELRGLSSSAVE